VVLADTAALAVEVPTCCARSPAACASAIEVATACCDIAFSRSEFLATRERAKPRFGVPPADFSCGALLFTGVEAACCEACCGGGLPDGGGAPEGGGGPF